MPDLPSTFLETAILALRERLGDNLTSPRDNSSRFVRDLYQFWKEEGGISAGRPRHSDKYLSNKLRENGTLVRSLTPKLASGRTNIKPEDARILINYFLNNWPESENTNTGEMFYEAILSDNQIEALASYVEENIGILNQPAADGYPGTDIHQLIATQFELSDALMTISPEHILISVHPRTELIGFMRLIDRLYEIEHSNPKDRLLIWILSIGDLRINDEVSRRKFLNLQSLASRFKSLKMFRDHSLPKLWDWINKRSVIFVIDHNRDNTSGLIPKKRPVFSNNHLSLTATESVWLSSTSFRALYGAQLERIEQRSFSVFEYLSDDAIGEVRYFGHALFSTETQQEGFVGRSLELPSLPFDYSIAFSTVYAAARHITKLGEDSRLHSNISGEEAVQQLEYLGCFPHTIGQFLGRY